jgi:membrane fusion protein (multidrug efflux system)
MTPSDDGRSTSAGEANLGFVLPSPRRVSRRRTLRVVLIVLALLAVAFFVGYVPRRSQRAALASAAESSRNALMRVELVSPRIGASERALHLPGTVQPFQETVVFARASGYVRAWHADIGDKVQRAQVLAEIETPELDQELSQAHAQLNQVRASLTQAKANRDLANANLGRARRLAPAGIVSKAELEQNTAQAEVGAANVSVASANVAAQQANIRRLEQLKAFAKLTAPFAGTVTQRNVEVGSLVTAGNNQLLFRIAATDPLRVFVQVPQDVAPGVRAGVPAKVSVREYPQRTFDGEVMRAAGELDSATRTMTTIIRVPNSDGALLPGMYAEVALTLPLPHQVFELPSTALMNDARGQRVAVVDAGNKVHLVPVVLEQDKGATIEISSGLHGGDKVAKLGSAALVDGMTVDVGSAPVQAPPVR